MILRMGPKFFPISENGVKIENAKGEILELQQGRQDARTARALLRDQHAPCTRHDYREGHRCDALGRAEPCDPATDLRDADASPVRTSRSSPTTRSELLADDHPATRETSRARSKRSARSRSTPAAASTLRRQAYSARPFRRTSSWGAPPKRPSRPTASIRRHRPRGRRCRRRRRKSTCPNATSNAADEERTHDRTITMRWPPSSARAAFRSLPTPSPSPNREHVTQKCTILLAARIWPPTRLASRSLLTSPPLALPCSRRHLSVALP